MRKFLILFFMMICPNAHAQWNANAATATNLIADSIDRELNTQITADSIGGAYILYRKEDKLLLQRVNEKGIVQFLTPVVLINYFYQNFDANIITDVDGNAIISYCKNTDSGTVYIQKVNAAGNKLLGDSGIIISKISKRQAYNPLTINGINHDLYISWEEADSYNSASLYVKVQRILPGGELAWKLNGIYAVNDSKSTQAFGEAVSDGAGGIIILYSYIYSSQQKNIVAVHGQRIDPLGNLTWGASGKLLTQDGGAEFRGGDINSIIPDDKGGAFFSYNLNIANMTSQVLAIQRINNMGERQWSTNGIVINEAGDYDFNNNLVSDGSGGVNIVWTQVPLNTTLSNIFVQSITGEGALRWKKGGIQITTNNESGLSSVCSDHHGHTIFTWDSNGKNLYAQSIDAITGAIQYEEGGIPITTGENSFPEFPVITYSPGTGAIIAWIDRWATTAPPPAVSKLFVEKITDKFAPLTSDSFTIVVSPNPVRENLNIQFGSISGSSEAYIQLFDDIGRLFFSKKITTTTTGYSNQQTIYVGYLPKAVYLLKVIQNKKFQAFKWIKG